MKKSDLKSGYLVEYRNGLRRLVIESSDNGFVLVDGKNEICNEGMNYKEDLSSIPTGDLDIVKVFGIPKSMNCFSVMDPSERNVIWERKPKKMTMKEICDALGYEVEIVKESDGK